MKARVKATGEIVEFDNCLYDDDGYEYHVDELDFSDNPDYWEKLKHQYAGMAMQALIIDASYAGSEGPKYLVEECVTIAHALVEKLKEV